MPARDGEITARRAALLLGIPLSTVRRWIKRAVDGNPLALRHGRIDVAKRHYAAMEEVEDLIASERSN